MTPRVRFLAALAGLTALAAAAPPADLPVRRGQSPAEVRAKLGPPQRVGRQILFGRHLDQWAYDDPRPVWVEFAAVRGQEPYACAILQLSPGNP